LLSQVRNQIDSTGFYLKISNICQPTAAIVLQGMTHNISIQKVFAKKIRNSKGKKWTGLAWD
jgi:hypothetical protein